MQSLNKALGTPTSHAHLQVNLSFYPSDAEALISWIKIYDRFYTTGSNLSELMCHMIVGTGYENAQNGEKSSGVSDDCPDKAREQTGAISKTNRETQIAQRFVSRWSTRAERIAAKRSLLGMLSQPLFYSLRRCSGASPSGVAIIQCIIYGDG